MQFSIDRDVFAKILKKIDGVASSRGSFAVLSSCLIEANDGSITATGTDLEITLRVTDKARIKEGGRVLLNAKRLLDTVQNLPSGVEVKISKDNNQVLLECGHFKARIPSGDISEFPQISVIESKAIFTIPALVLKDLIDKVAFSISRDDSRADFTGALMTLDKDGKIQMVSTDGHRLSRIESEAEIQGELPPALEKGIIIPHKALNELSKNLIEGLVSVDLNGGKVIVQTSTMSFYINLIAGQFPNFSRVIPAMLDHKAIVRREALRQSLRRASIYTAKIGTIRLSMSRNQLEISTYDASNGEMRDVVECEYEGSGVTAGFNWRYIDDILNAVDGDTISFEIIDMDSPALLRDTSTNKLDYIVMPMQL